MRSDRGIISMITTIMVSILLITMMIALVALMSGSLQQSSNDELSVRAYAAAEGGLEWALAYLHSNPGSNFANCTAALALDPNLFSFDQPGGVTAGPTGSYQNAITCLKITQQSNKVTGTLGPTDSNNITVPPNAPPLQYIYVNWVGRAEPAPNGAATSVSLPCDSTKPGCANPLTAAALELTLTPYTINAGNIQSSSIAVRNVLFLPSDSGASAIDTEPKVIGDCVTKIVVGSPFDANYRCHARIQARFIGGVPQGLTANNQGEVISVRGRYLNSSVPQVSYSLSFAASGGGPFQVDSQDATIDVTARSGPVYRRIIAQSATPGASNLGNLNYVLFGDKDICKNFSFYKSAAGSYTFSSICPPYP